MSGLAAATTKLAEKAIFDPGTTYYLSLTGSYNAAEASGGSYARKAITFGTPVTTGGTWVQRSTNSQAVTTSASANAWPHFCVWTTSTGGSRKWAGTRTDATAGATLGPGAVVTFAVGAIVAEIAGVQV